MRQVVFVATTLFVLACGPSPNARLPGEAAPPSQGGSGSGGASSGSGGVVSSNGGNPFAGGGGSGGSSPFSSGGFSSAGGSPFATGGLTSAGGSFFGDGGSLATTGGNTGLGGSTVPAFGGASSAGGTTTASSGALATYTFGTGPEPCTSPKDVSGGQSGNLGTGAVCLRTADDFTSWNCSSMSDRTIKINSVSVNCGDAPPPKAGSFYYFDVSAGATAWASFSWFCTVQGCGPHPIPACGNYPAWVSGGSAAPCAN
jgi:hypothetical protein